MEKLWHNYSALHRITVVLIKLKSNLNACYPALVIDKNIHILLENKTVIKYILNFNNS